MTITRSNSEKQKAIAIQLLQNGNLAKAEEAFRAMLEQAPQDAGTINNLGLAMLYQGKMQQVIPLYQDALHRFPEIPDLHYNLGLAYHKAGVFTKARLCYQQATRLRPSFCDAFRNLSAACLELGQEEPALEAIRKAHELRPDDAAIQFQLLALEEGNVPAPPREYVSQLFDNYAAHFDRHLTTTLGYAIPQHLRNALELFVEPKQGVFRNAIDLGCGTGLAGSAIRDLCTRLTGIDLSPAMLAEADAKQVYDTLRQDDLHEALAMSRDTYDLVVATDVMIYMGALEQVFARVRERIVPGGYFCFSLETDHGTATYRLRRTARYGHNPLYTQELAHRHRFLGRLSLPVIVRKEGSTCIAGELIILQSQ